MRKILVLLILAGGACTPVYIPNSRSVPLFNEGGEVAVDGYVGTAGIDLNVGASVSDHIAIIGGFSFNDSNGEDSEDYQKHNFWEVGLGYFNATESKLRTEFFGGYGMGESTSYDSYFFISQIDELTTGNYNRAFLQGNLGFKPSRIFEFGVAIRLAHVTFTKFETTTTTYDKSWSANFAEPAFFLKLGDPIHFSFQTGLNVPLDNDPAFDYRFFHMSLGIGARIDLMGKKNKQVDE
jgi:hypothetical protein